MHQLKRTLFFIVSVLLLFIFAGCEKDSALPKNIEENDNEAIVQQEELEDDNIDLVKEENDEVAEDKTETIQEENKSDKQSSNEQVSSTDNNKTLAGKSEANINNNNSTNNNKTSEHNITSTTNPTQSAFSSKSKTEAANSSSINQQQSTQSQQNESSKEKNSNEKASTPAPPPAQKQEEKPKDTITISIQGVDGIILPATKVEIESGETVLSATIKILKEKRIPISVRGSGATAYVEGIANQFEFDHGPLSGWKVNKNGQYIPRSTGIEPVANGDLIEWYYTTEG